MAKMHNYIKLDRLLKNPVYEKARTSNVKKHAVEILRDGGVIGIKAERCKRSLFYFMQTFWECVSNDQPQWNWHISFLCSELEFLARRVANGEPKLHDLIINIPPGTTKSTTCTIMFPVWCWINWSWMRFIAGAYSGALALEHAEYSRDLVKSEKFRQYFPNLEIKQDKDAKSNFRVQYHNDDGTTHTSIDL